MTRTRLLPSLVGVALLAALPGCNGKSKLTGTVGAFNLAEAKFAFFGRADGFGVDFDGDEVNDATASLVVVVTDKRSLCKDMENISIVNGGQIGEGLASLENAQLLVMNAGLFVASSDESPLKNNTTIAEDGTNSLEVGFRAFVTDDQQQVQQTNADEIDPTDMVLTVNGINPLQLRGELTGTLTPDGVEQIAIGGNFTAAHCGALDLIALTGGLNF